MCNFVLYFTYHTVSWKSSPADLTYLWLICPLQMLIGHRHILLYSQGKTWGIVQYSTIQLILRSCIASKPKCCMEKWMDHFESCQNSCQISTRSDNFIHKSGSFQTLWNLMIRVLHNIEIAPWWGAGKIHHQGWGQLNQFPLFVIFLIIRKYKNTVS